MCPEIPFWFIWLAVTGACFYAALLMALAAGFIFNAIERRPATHAGQIKRRLFR